MDRTARYKLRLHAQGFLAVLRGRHLYRAGLSAGGLRRNRFHRVLRVSRAQLLARLPRENRQRQLAYRPRLAARFSTFSHTSAGLSPTREYSCLRLMSASAASRSAPVANQCVRCHSPPMILRNGSPGRRLTRTPYGLGTRLVGRRRLCGWQTTLIVGWLQGLNRDRGGTIVTVTKSKTRGFGDASF